MKFSKQFKKSFSYTWYMYLIAIILPPIVFPLSYSFMHRPKDYEKLVVFLPWDVENKNAKNELFNDLKDTGIRSCEIVSCDISEDEAIFNDKFSVVGVNRCDLIVLPEEKLSPLGAFLVGLELNSDVKEKCKIENENLYKHPEEEKYYAVELPNESEIFKFGTKKNDVNYYAFLNAKSVNIGEYSKKSPHSENAFEFMKYVLGK